MGYQGTDAALARRELPERIYNIVSDIAKALINYTKDKRVFKEQFSSYTLKTNQKVKIEDLLQIFVDDLELVKRFLQEIINTYGEKNSAELDQLTTINLYHRLLEYMLYSRQIKRGAYHQPENSKFKDEIISFIVRYD